MKVKQLIDLLNTYDPEMPVCMLDINGKPNYLEIDYIYKSDGVVEYMDNGLEIKKTEIAIIVE